MNSLTSRVLVFAKAPVPGNVKTRLQPTLTPQQSVSVHRALVQYCLSQLCEYVALSPQFDGIELWVAGDHPWWLELERQFELTVFEQRGENLGERMAFAAEDALLRLKGSTEAAATNSVLIVGTDCPFIDGEYLAQGAKALRHHDVVLGPAEDGGYVMIGFKKPCAAIFSQVSWGSELVLEQTRERLDRLGLSWWEQKPLPDIDRPQDLQKVFREKPDLAEQFKVDLKSL